MQPKITPALFTSGYLHPGKVKKEMVYMEKLLAKAFLNALDEIAKLRGEDFDYFETACELMDGFTNSEVLDFLDKYGGEDD